MGLLESRIAVVTGAGRGIGRAVALAFAAEGASLALAARTEGEIESAADEIRSAGGRAIAIPTDVTSQDDVDTLFTHVSEQLGTVDILVNNAAIIGPTGMLWDIDPAAWQETFEVNVIGLVRCCRAVLPSMVERRSGKIINVGSNAGWSDGWAEAFPEQSAYASTKAAVIRFSEVLAQQVKPYGINVNCLGVSAQTRMSYEANVAVARVRGTVPPRPPEETPRDKRVLPEENVGAFLFLASSLSDHISGAYFEANQLPAVLQRGAKREG